MTRESFNIQRYTGSEFVMAVKPGDVLRQWQSHAEASRESEPLVYFPPRRFFPDTASTADLNRFKEEGMFNQVAGRGIVLVASLSDPRATLDVLGTARWLRAFGAEEIMLLATRLYGLRQDDVFSEHGTGRVRMETPTAFDSISQIADATGRLDGRRLVNRLVLVEVHSHNAFQYASVKNLPAIGLTAYQCLADEINLRARANESWRALNPDPHRHSTGRLLAEYLGTELASFKKERDRETGQVKLIQPELVVDRLRQEGVTTGVIFDDEQQTGATIKLLTDAAGEVLEEFIILVTHANFTRDTLSNLSSPKISQMIVTDAMQPNEKITQLPNGIKVQVLPLSESLSVVAGQLWRGNWQEPLAEGWQLDPWLKKELR